MIPRSQVKKTIHKLLPENQARAFFLARQYLMVRVLEQESEIVEQRLNEWFDSDQKLISEMVDLYRKLANTFFTITERVNSNKSVTSDKSLLDYLTDGESHLKIYPNVNFNI